MTKETAQQKSLKLTEKAMLVTLTLGCPSFRKYDRKVSDKVAETYKIKNGDDAGRYNKILIAKEEIGKMQKLFSRARMHHYTMTLPWSDANQRVMLNSMYIDYTNKLRAIFNEIDDKLHNEFLPNYPALVNEAKQRLGDMFDPNDYPDPDVIESKFNYRFSVMPIPDKEDFRVDMQGDEIERIKADIENCTNEAVKNAMNEVCRRMLEVVSKMAKTLKDKEAIFRDSLVRNVCELMEIVPKLNLTDDPALESIRRDVEKKLCRFDAQTLREDKAARAHIANDAKALADKMSAYMGSL